MQNICHKCLPFFTSLSVLWICSIAYNLNFCFSTHPVSLLLWFFQKFLMKFLPKTFAKIVNNFLCFCQFVVGHKRLYWRKTQHEMPNVQIRGEEIYCRQYFTFSWFQLLLSAELSTMCEMKEQLSIKPHT